MNNPRTTGVVSVVLGIVLLLQGLIDLLFAAESSQFSFSTPWPDLDQWLVENLGSTGVRRAGDALLIFGGVLLMSFGRRTLTARSRADAA